MRLALACLCAMFLTACDVSVDSEKDEKETTVQPQDTVTQIPADTTSRVGYKEDTLAKTSTTVTLVRKTLQIRGKDTSVLHVDTVRLLNGKVLMDSAISVQPPCADGEGATFYNAYGRPVVLEFWTGKSLEYRDSRVYGIDPERQGPFEVSHDSTHNRHCQKLTSGDVMIIVGTPASAKSTYPLSHGQFLLTSSSILVVDEQGVIRPLH